MCLIHGVKLFLNGSLVCYSQRDSHLEILRKTGSLKQNLIKKIIKKIKPAGDENKVPPSNNPSQQI
jgi:hypothetical protein